MRVTNTQKTHFNLLGFLLNSSQKEEEEETEERSEEEEEEEEENQEEENPRHSIFERVAASVRSLSFR